MTLVSGVNTFKREFEIESVQSVINIHQYEVGDVGCVVWDAAIVLAKYLDIQNAQQRDVLQNKNVLELGSGTGLVGIVSACLGANVILSDLPEVIPLLEFNIFENQSSTRGVVRAQVLRWGETPNEKIQPDVILVSDCVYYEKSIEPLVKTIGELSGPNTEVLIAYEERELGNKQELQVHFIYLLQKEFSIEEIPQSSLHPDYNSPDIHVLKLKKK